MPARVPYGRGYAQQRPKSKKRHRMHPLRRVRERLPKRRVENPLRERNAMRRVVVNGDLAVRTHIACL